MHWCITRNMSSKFGEKVKIFISISKYHKMIIWYSNDILLKSIIFSNHTGNHSKYRSYFIFLPYIIIHISHYHDLWQTVIYIHLNIISITFCAIISQIISVIAIFLTLRIYVIWAIIETKTLEINNKITSNQHICGVYWYLEFVHNH